MKPMILGMFIPFLFSCASVKRPPSIETPEWLGKGREEVKAAFSHLTPKTEEKKITYHDTDPIPSEARCAVVGCYPWTFGPRINCTYIFKFENDRVVKATREGRCRD
ncbi:MAG: hypothetical protein V4598_03885 [Bdellovibrionota bacterium]